MKYTSYADMNCSLAQTLEVVGERWTLLILRDVFFGIRKFDDLCANLGIARNVLSVRLKRLRAEQILVRSRVDGKRWEYRLTEKGLALQPVLLAMTQWGDVYYPNPKGDRVRFVDRKTGLPVQRLATQNTNGEPLKPLDIRAVRGEALSDDDVFGRL